MPYRVPSPPEQEAGADIEEAAYAKRLARLGTRERIRFGVVVLSVLAGLFVLGLRSARRPARSGPNVDRLSAASVSMDLTRAGAEDAQKRFASAILDAFTGPSSSTECPLALPSESTLSKNRRTLSLVIATEAEVAEGSLTSPQLTTVFEDLRRAEARLSRGLLTLPPSRALAPKMDFVVVARKLTDPRATGPSSYEPGTVEGRVFVYDFATSSVLCSADLRATSATEIGYTYSSSFDAPAWQGRRASFEASLEDDFRFEIERAVLHSLGKHSSL